MIRSPLVVLCLLFVAGGCSRSYPYEVEVINRTDRMIVPGLVSPGEAVEDWDGPEHIAIEKPQYVSRHWRQPLPPGKSCVLVSPSTPFPAGGYLRVYADDRTIEELLSYSHNDPHRLDEPVYAGRSAFAIIERGGRLVAQPIDLRKTN